MCLINFAYKAHPNYKFVVAANRDEFFARKTKNAHFWPEYPFMLGGKDLEQGGMWLGITKTGRFGALTNYREKEDTNKTYRTRGELVKNFLISDMAPDQYLLAIDDRKDEYPGFNLIVGHVDDLYFYSNRANGIKKLEKGIYSLCNGEFDCNWQKVERGKQYMKEAFMINGEKEMENFLFQSLIDEQKAPDDKLPNTGFSKDLERFLSSIFINGDDYGTRSSTVLLVDKNNKVTFTEKTYKPDTNFVTYSYVMK